MQPIWKDYRVGLGSSDAVDFRIVSDAEVLYTGRAYKRPGASVISIRINDICADRLSAGLGAGMDASGFMAEATAVFQVQSRTGSSWTTVDTVTMMNDWSYDPAYDPAADGMAFPVTARLDGRQVLTFSAYNITEITATLKFASGGTQQVTLKFATLGSFDGSFNDDYEVESTGKTGVAELALSDYPGLVSVTVGGVTYEVVGDCYRYALYYLNAVGGWDSLLLEGVCVPSASVDRHSYERDYDGADLSARGTDNFVNEITRSWTLRTGVLTDAQASRMHHLLNSTKVYLLDIPAGQMLPVVLSTDSYEEKSFKSGGRAPVQYEMTATLAQQRLRQ